MGGGGVASLRGLTSPVRAGGLLMEATVTTPALSAAGWLRVILDAQPGVVREVPWMPRPVETPGDGDAALVAESDGGSLWCVAWWPQ